MWILMTNLHEDMHTFAIKFARCRVHFFNEPFTRLHFGMLPVPKGPVRSASVIVRKLVNYLTHPRGKQLLSYESLNGNLRLVLLTEVSK